ncbi:putative DNA polymerase-like protein [Triplophysa rosa]|uniref:DNA polymerase-like protein n=1 Tax=Triplophysa rosa TaxID=992332 RepID=A0A9W7T2X1_TRIRA|nr:putative DNA polymerase-like protein [Triplophysa rosa]
MVVQRWLRIPYSDTEQYKAGDGDCGCAARQSWNSHTSTWKMAQEAEQELRMMMERRTEDEDGVEWSSDSNNYDQDEFVNIEQLLNTRQDTASNQDLQGSIERPIFIDLTHDEEAGSSSASIDLTASEEEVGSSRAVPDPSLLIERSCDLTTGGDAGIVVPEPSLFIERSCDLTTGGDAGIVVPEPSLFIERSCGSGDDVSNWTDTQLNVWERSSWSSEREERSPIRRQQTPLAEQEDIADDERSSSARGRQTPFALQDQNTVSLDQLNAILRESNIPLHESIDRLWGSVGQGIGAQHKCAPVRCLHCGEDLVVTGSHRCFIQPHAPKDPSEKYIFYDFETRYENEKHVANFVCAITFKGEQFVAEGAYCVASLINHFRQRRYKGYTFIAHYASKFDSFLILEYFCKAGLTLDIIMQGCKLICIYDSTYAQRYIDSYSFIPMALSKTPAALNLTATEKGYFPHHFNRAENEKYVGPYPDKTFYGYDNMTDKNQDKFDAWYATVSGKIFDFMKELRDYGVNDVILLREACMKYRQSFMECTELDPFSFTTLASCCMGVFKAHYLERDTLALTHNNAYVQKSKTYSNVSIEWLEYLKKTRNADIHHAVNYSELSIGNYFLDGYYE